MTRQWLGKYRAFVRDNNDPERLGRARLEIPAVLGTGPANWSEWAYPCFPYGGNEDSGMFYVPEVGASVWAEFEGGPGAASNLDRSLAGQKQSGRAARGKQADLRFTNMPGL